MAIMLTKRMQQDIATKGKHSWHYLSKKPKSDDRTDHNSTASAETQSPHITDTLIAPSNQAMSMDFNTDQNSERTIQHTHGDTNDIERERTCFTVWCEVQKLPRTLVSTSVFVSESKAFKAVIILLTYTGQQERLQVGATVHLMGIPELHRLAITKRIMWAMRSSYAMYKGRLLNTTYPPH